METLERWHDFFLLVGTAGATLVALLFVAVSVGAGFLSPRRKQPTQAFFSPIVVHFTAIFLIAGLALIPSQGALSFAGWTALSAITGGIISIYATVQLLRNTWTRDVRDHLGYGLCPTLCYVAVLVADVMIIADDANALSVLAAALLVLMLVNIRNAWDLMLSMIWHQSGRRR